MTARHKLRRAPGDISPKVATSTGGSALGVVVAWLLTKVPIIDTAPGPVQAALVVVVIGALTFASGYLRPDRVPRE
jgi:hypothetical protein